ncbi:MAG: phosphotransferase family protein, partial [Paracoccaceae bacterium]
AIAAIAVEAVEGPDFGRILATGRLPEIAAASRRTARALTGFHGCAVGVADRRDRSFYTRRAAAAAPAISAIAPQLARAARRLADWIAQTPAPLRPGLAHMDMKPEHLIVTDDAITLLDLDSVARSDGLYDLAMLEMRIHSARASGVCDTDQTDAAIRALQPAYPDNGTACRARRHAWLRACATLEVAKHQAQSPSPGWCERVTAVLNAGCPGADPSPANPATVACRSSA